MNSAIGSVTPKHAIIQRAEMLDKQSRLSVYYVVFILNLCVNARKLFFTQKACAKIKYTLLLSGALSAEAEVVAEGDLDGRGAGGAEVVGFGGGEDVAQAEVVAGFEHQRVARPEVELYADAGGDAVVKAVLDVHCHLSGDSCGRNFGGGGVGVVEVGAFVFREHIRNLGAEVDKAFEASRAEVDMRHYRQRDVCQVALVGQLRVVLEVFLPSALCDVELADKSEDFFLGISECDAAGKSVVHLLIYGRRE